MRSGLKIRGQNAEKRTAGVVSFSRSARFACGTVVVAAGLVYLNALDNPFIYDDHVLIGENQSLLAPLNLLGLVLHDVSRPVINFSYAVDRTLWGPSPFGFHVTNVLLHMLNVGLLFLLAATALRHDGRPLAAADDAPSPVVVASVAAVLLAVHPMMTQAVGYISGRSEVLCTTWLLSAGRWMKTSDGRWLAATGGLWLLALATKETAAMFPLLLLMYDRLVVPTGDRVDRRQRVLWLHLPFFSVTTVFVIARVAVLSLVEHAEAAVPQWQFVWVELDVARQYLLLLLTPGEQSIFHAVSPVSGPFDPRALASLATVGGPAGARLAGSPHRRPCQLWPRLVHALARAIEHARRARPRGTDGGAPCVCGQRRALSYHRVGCGLADRPSLRRPTSNSARRTDCAHRVGSWSGRAHRAPEHPVG